MRTICCLLIALVGTALVPIPGSAQCDNDQNFDDIFAPDSSGVAVLSDSIPRTRVTASYRVIMPFDSGQVTYDLAEVRKNNARVLLSTWCDGADIRTWSLAQMNDSTRTASFTVVTGDTVSFFRQLSWYNPADTSGYPQQLNNFYSLDTLDYVVELVRASDNVSLVPLDSLGVLRKVPSGSPSFYGSRPIAAKVTYVVPSQMNGTIVYLRLKSNAWGAGEFSFVRRDRMSLGASYNLDSPEWVNYLDEYGGGLGAKRVIEDLGTLTDRPGVMLIVAPNPSTGASTVDFLAPEGGKVIVSVYDAMGRFIFAPAITSSSNKRSSCVFEFPASGQYFVTLSIDGRFVASRTIIVNR